MKLLVNGEYNFNNKRFQKNDKESLYVYNLYRKKKLKILDIENFIKRLCIKIAKIENLIIDSKASLDTLIKLTEYIFKNKIRNLVLTTCLQNVNKTILPENRNYLKIINFIIKSFVSQLGFKC